MRFKRLRRARKFKLRFPSLSIPWILAILYITIVIVILTGPIFKLERFACTTNTLETCPDFVIPELEKYTHEYIYLIQTDDLENRLKKNLPRADYLTITPIWPDLLQTTIVWQHPIVNLSIPASSSALLVGNNGQILNLVDIPDPQLPTIIASSAADLIISDRINEPSLQAAFDIVKNFKTANIKTNTINLISPQNIQVNLNDDRIAVFTSLKSIPVQVRTLQLILSQATINSGLKIIDLRLDRPALKPTQ